MKKYDVKNYGVIDIVENKEGDDFIIIPMNADLKTAIFNAIEFINIYYEKEMEIKFESGFNMIIYPGQHQEEVEKELIMKTKNMVSRIEELTNQIEKGI